MFSIQKLIHPALFSNTYVISHKGYHNIVWMVDAGSGAEVIESLPENVSVKGIFVTHAHYDHILDLEKIADRYPDVVIYCSLYTGQSLRSSKSNLSFYHNSPIEYKKDNIVTLSDKEKVVLFGEYVVETIKTPGHNKGSLSFKVNNYIFTGDSLIPGIKVVTKLKSGNRDEALTSIDKLKNMCIPGDFICPGHSDICPVEDIDWDLYK